MVRTDYTVTLEELASLSYSAVSAASKEGGAISENVLCEIGRGRDKKICALEDSFCFFNVDFENDVLAFAAGLSGVIDASKEYYFAVRRATRRELYENEEAAVCALLAERICRETELLSYLNTEIDIDGFYKLLQKGRLAHENLLDDIRICSNPRCYGHCVIASARLRRAIALAFDALVKLKEKMRESELLKNDFDL